MQNAEARGKKRLKSLVVGHIASGRKAFQEITISQSGDFGSRKSWLEPSGAA